MYLKSLELHGFKSFPDKVSLEFGKGLTAVVGPNGSGKSNIGDAVRWVLGEQSSKTLRGGKMEDVIFGGTEKRKPVSFASVTLNIANDDRTLGINSDDVSVTRKLYRNGDSEYLINGSQVRLKDVLELFMDTGLGRDGYSIIGQGRVADIVSSKSNDRREIFEEAAGIAKFRYKKAESERKIAAAEDNILRLKDIISELESRVEPLKIQSEKAKKYLELANQRKSLEISVWTHRLSELKFQVSEFENLLLIAKSEYEHLTNEISALEDNAEELAKKRRQCASSVEEYRAKIEGLNESNAGALADIAVYKNNILHYSQNITELEGKIKELFSSEKDVSAAINNKRLEIEGIISDRTSLEIETEELEERLKKLNLEASEFSKEAADAQEKLNRSYIERSELKFSSASSAASRSEALFSKQEALKLADETRQKLKDAEKERSEIELGISDIEKSISEHNNKLSGFNMLYAKKSDQLKNVSDELNEAELSFRSAASKRQMLFDLENSMEGFAGSVKSVVSAGKSGRLRGVRGTVSQLISADTKYSLAIETALGGGLQNIVVENESAAKAGIRFLKDTNGGRATFLPITSVKGSELRENGLDMCEGYVALASELVECADEYKGIVLSLLGRIVVAENIDLAANIAKKYGYRFKVITLDGQMINAGGSFTGGSSSKTAGMLSRKNEIAALDSELKSLASKSQKLKEKHTSLFAEVEKLGYDVDGERDIISAAEGDKIRFDGEKTRIDLVISQLCEKLSELEKSVASCDDRIKQCDETVSSSQKRLSQLEDEISALETDLGAADEKNADAANQRETLSNELSQKRLKLAELGKDIEAAEAVIVQMKSGIDESRAAASEHERKISELKEQIEKENQAISERIEEQNKAKAAIGNLNLRIGQERDMIIEYEREENRLRSDSKSKIERRESAASELSRLGERVDSLKRDNDAIISQLWESYSLTVAEAESQSQKLDDISEANKKLSQLRAKIKDLGSVNTDAIDEYEQVSKRYEYLSSQLGDVLKSKSELEKLISELTKSMKEIFSQSFVKINENFKRIFVELFGGGRAELSLTDPENILESGIEINVAPPGKVIKSLSLLSGGEQSFVAIAIYFAILSIRPSPFCILDEIEAALDDVNVSKYASYLRNFTDKTQFILITHRRGTMEEADILYGVTMQEKGVSKLLKMDVSDVSFTEDN